VNQTNLQIQKLESYLATVSFLPESKIKRLLIDYEQILYDAKIDTTLINNKKIKSIINKAAMVLPVIPLQNTDIQYLSVKKFYEICLQICCSENQCAKTLITVLKKIIRHYGLCEDSDTAIAFNKLDDDFINEICIALSIHTKKTKTKYVTYALKLKKYYHGSIFSLKNLPDDFSEAIKSVHEQSGLSVSQAEHKAKIKRNGARHIITGKHTPSYKQIENILKLEIAYNIPKYSLVSKLKTNNYWRKIDTKLIPELFRTKTNLWTKLLSNLKIDFNSVSEKERYEICDWIYNNIVVSNTVYGKRLRTKLKKKYKFDELENAKRLKNELTELIAHKESNLPDFYLKKFGTWSEATSQKNTDIILYFTGYLKNINNETSSLLPSDYSLLLLLSKKLIYAYIKWQIDRRGMLSFGDYCILDLIISFCNEETGYMYQKNFLSDAPNKVIDLLEIKRSDGLTKNDKSHWEQLCVNQKDFCIKFRGELDKLYKKNQIDRNGHLILSRDTFEPICAILDKDEPWLEYYKLLKICRENYSISKTQPKLNFSFLCSYLSAVFLLQTGLRSKNIRLLKLSNMPENNNTTIYFLGDKYYIDAPWSHVKNHRKVLRELIDANGLYEDIDQYLFLKKKLFTNNQNDNFFVTWQNNTYSPASFGKNFIDFTRVYIAYNKYKDQHMIENLHPHYPHAIRHIIATHVLKQTKSFAEAALSIHDTEQTVRQHYARFLPSDECESFKYLSKSVFV